MFKHIVIEDKEVVLRSEHDRPDLERRFGRCSLQTVRTLLRTAPNKEKCKKFTEDYGIPPAHAVTKINGCLISIWKAGLEIDWTKAPDWAQWLAIDQPGSAYWYRDRPEVLNEYIWDIPKGPDSCAFGFYTEEPEDFTRALYERPPTPTNEETSMNYTLNLISVVRIRSDLSDSVTEIAEVQWRDARDLVSLVGNPDDERQWPKIKMIKLYRTMHPGIGLCDAMVVVEAAWQERHSYY